MAAAGGARRLAIDSGDAVRPGGKRAQHPRGDRRRAEKGDAERGQAGTGAFWRLALASLRRMMPRFKDEM